MPKWCDANKCIGNNKRNLSSRYSFDSLEVVKEFTWRGLIGWIHESKKEVAVSMFDPEQGGRVAVLYFNKKNGGLEGSFAAIHRKYHGRGIGKRIYKKLLKMYGKITSSDTLTGETGYGSFNLYQSLSKLKGIKSYLYDTKSKEYREVPQFTRDMMKYYKTRLVLSYK